MTFSIAARSADGSHYGVAVASKFLAVGSAVPAAAADVGAIATQSLANLAYRPDGLLMLAAGKTAAETLTTLTAADGLREQRQAGIVGSNGDGASWTGSECHPWAGGRVGDGYAIQGNILVGEQVVVSMESTWLGSEGLPFPERLFAALRAGDNAGGDKRGRQSAAVLVVTPGGGYGGGSDMLVDLRVDDHQDPVGELARLLELHELYFGATVESLVLEGELADEVALLVSGAGHPTLESWMGTENYEDRHVEGGIDIVVLAKLRETRPDPV